MAKIEIAIEVKKGLNCGNCEHWHTLETPKSIPTGFCLLARLSSRKTNKAFAPGGLITQPDFYCNQHKPKK